MQNNFKSLLIYIIGILVGLVFVILFNSLIPIPFELRIVLIIFFLYLVPRLYNTFKNNGYISKLQSFQSLSYNQKITAVIVVIGAIIVIVLTYAFIIKPQIDKVEFTQCVESSNKSPFAINTCSLKVLGRPGVNITY